MIATEALEVATIQTTSKTWGQLEVLWTLTLTLESPPLMTVRTAFSAYRMRMPCQEVNNRCNLRTLERKSCKLALLPTAIKMWLEEATVLKEVTKLNLPTTRLEPSICQDQVSGLTRLLATTLINTTQTLWETVPIEENLDHDIKPCYIGKILSTQLNTDTNRHYSTRLCRLTILSSHSSFRCLYNLHRA